MQTLKNLIVLLFLVLLLQVRAYPQYENQAYLPLSRAEISKKFPVKYAGTLGNQRPGYFESLEDKPLAGKLAIGPSGATVTTTTEDNFVVAGKDKHNHDWTVQLGLSYACRFYEADLDHNEIRDAVIVFPTGGNGLAPTSHLLAITFDRNGRPVTFEADGYFQESGGKIFDLVDLDQDGQAELIYMNFDDGYWITNLYEVTNARWKKKAGRQGRRVYPLYTRFTLRENHKPSVPKSTRHPFAPDLSNTSPRLLGRLISYQWANASQSEDISLRVRERTGKVVSSQPVSWYSSFVVVVDSNEGRKIVSLSANEAAVKSLLDKIVGERYEVALYGQRRFNTSSPEILWAHPRNQRCVRVPFCRKGLPHLWLHSASHYC